MTDTSNASRNHPRDSSRREFKNEPASGSADRSSSDGVGKQELEQLQRMLTQEVRERPMRAIGIAAAVGLCVGFLAAR